MTKKIFNNFEIYNNKISLRNLSKDVKALELIYLSSDSCNNGLIKDLTITNINKKNVNPAQSSQKILIIIVNTQILFIYMIRKKIIRFLILNLKICIPNGSI